jgi:hypothetical protein
VVRKKLDSEYSSHNKIGSQSLKPRISRTSEGKIKSEKNPQAKGDTMNIEDRHSDTELNRDSDIYNSRQYQSSDHKIQNKISKQPVVTKSLKDGKSNINTSKKLGSHSIEMSTLDDLMQKSNKLQMKSQKEALVTSTDSGPGGAHKKPRQPKQRIGVTSKVSSNEKDSEKALLKKGNSLIDKYIESEHTGSRARLPTTDNSFKLSDKEKNTEDDYHVIMKKGKNSKVTSKEKPKNEKKKRITMKEHIKAAKTKVNPPMVFLGVEDNEDKELKPKRSLLRTPPRAKDTSPQRDEAAGGMG